MKHIDTTHESVINLQKLFTKKRIDDRINSLRKFAQDFIMDMEIASYVRISEIALAHAVYDYFADISRIKEFHNEIKRTNKFKIYAYECYWIWRRKIIQVIDEPSEDIEGFESIAETLAFVNERFVLSLISSFLFEETEGLPDQKNLRDERRDKYNAFVVSLEYYLRYRHVNAQILEMILISYAAGNESALHFIG